MRLLPLVPLLLSACATPVAPTGGLEDTTPPALVASTPEAGAVHVTTDRLVLTFSERIDGTTVARALTVTPEPTTRPDTRVSGRTLEIVFEEALRPDVTYVVTLGTELRDLHGVQLRQPIAVAFATGATLDRGLLAGRVLDPATGRGVAGLDVFAYRLADGLPPDSARPDYRTQTGPGGAFQFAYLREGPFFVAAVEDRNRNRRADAAERFAAPPDTSVLAVSDSLARADTAFTLYVTRHDAMPPQVRRTRGLSSRRFTVRFDEAVRLANRDPAAWALADSATGQAASLDAIYQSARSLQEVVVRAAGALPPAAHRLTLPEGAVRDSSGNPNAAFVATVSPSTAPDTVQLRFAGFFPARTAPADTVVMLRPDEAPAVRFSEPPPGLASFVYVAVTDSTRLPYTPETDDGVTYRLRLTERPPRFTVTVRLPDSTFTRRFAYPRPDDLGAILGTVQGSPGGPVLVEAHPESGDPFTARMDERGGFALRDLPPGTYRLRLVLDRNGNGRWDGGALVPYVPPEPLRWLPEPARVRARWETEVEPVRIEE
ncbi:MAG TPA: Ig-like domain-containing protein [Rubricoccaceae bacterium]|nr:Ig-like domain-containing protein [Rubricoccaceae bacterium]